MNMASHPANIKAVARGPLDRPLGERRALVDTVGFAPGVLSPPILHTDRLHVVERFSLDPAGPTLHAQLHGRGSGLLRGHVQRQRHARGRPTFRIRRTSATSSRSSTTRRKDNRRRAESASAAKPWWKFWD